MTKTIEKLVDRVTDLESKMSDLRHNDLESVTEMEQVTTVTKHVDANHENAKNLTILEKSPMKKKMNRRGRASQDL